jgi:purine-binding chemotaxis protein CheW
VAAGLKYKNKTRTIQAFVDSSDMTVSASRWASHSQAHVKGVINLRGKVIPVVDLHLQFGLPAQEYTPRTCIIVVQVRGEARPMLMGIVVDRVAEVLNLAVADIEDTPDFGDGTTAPYLLGMAKVKGKVKILLEIDRVLTSTELHGLDALAH